MPSKKLDEILLNLIVGVADRDLKRTDWLATDNVNTAKQAILDLISRQVTEARIEENQMYLDNINNWKPEPGQLTAASFGSAGAAITEMSYKRAFEDRIQQLKKGEGDE